MQSQYTGAQCSEWLSRGFARTPRQIEVLEKFIELENVMRTGAALGVTAPVITKILKAVRKRALSAGYAPDHNWVNGVVPEGHRVKGRSQLLNADGSIDQEWVKSERDRVTQTPMPEGFNTKRISLNTDGQGTVVSKWVIAEPEKQKQWELFWEACERAVERYRGVAAPIPSTVDYERGTTLYGLGDHHFGMLSWAPETGHNYDTRIAEKYLIEVSRRLVGRTTPTRHAILANVGDFFHGENDEWRTPAHKNPLDGDSRSAKVIEAGLVALRALIDLLLTKHDVVHAVMVPGNHDPQLGLMLRLLLKAVYENEPRVIVEDNRNPFFYLEIEKVLFGFTHGHHTKLEALGSIMAADQKEAWGRTVTKLWVTGHRHHKQRIELPGRCWVEIFNTLAPVDHYNRSKGYGAAQEFKAITFNHVRETGSVTEGILPEEIDGAGTISP